MCGAASVMRALHGEAGHEVTVAMRLERRRFRPAARAGECAARREGAALAEVVRRRHHARESRSAAPSSSPASTASRPSGRGCTDAAAGRTARRPPASSTFLPAYITTTRSQHSATTPRSWVISTTPMPSRRCSPCSRSRICAWIVTSSAVVGSSAISTSGLQASAIAIITRWRMPPESWCGYSSTRRSGSGICTSAQHLDRALAAPRAPLTFWCTARSRRSAGRS